MKKINGESRLEISSVKLQSAKTTEIAIVNVSFAFPSSFQHLHNDRDLDNLIAELKSVIYNVTLLRVYLLVEMRTEMMKFFLRRKTFTFGLCDSF